VANFTGLSGKVPNKPQTAYRDFPDLHLTLCFQELGKLPETGIWEKDNHSLLTENEENSIFLLIFIGEEDRFKTPERPQKQG